MSNHSCVSLNTPISFDFITFDDYCQRISIVSPCQWKWTVGCISFHLNFLLFPSNCKCASLFCIDFWLENPFWHFNLWLVATVKCAVQNAFIHFVLYVIHPAEYQSLPVIWLTAHFQRIEYLLTFCLSASRGW